ncbi:MAG TPA: peptidase inhibitor family I36 protein [Streptosporangiaceae bacterium]|nr:peptidase inhibitor family I36 protein [Streptosporangiaceae bacterium]
MNRTFFGRAAITAAATAALLASGGAAASAQASPTTASAAPAVANHCNKLGKVCIWQNVGFTGDKGHFSGANLDWSTFSGGTDCATGNWNNCASSIFNNKTERAVILWETINKKGGKFCVATMTGYSDFVKHHFDNSHHLNDAVSSDSLESGPNC